MLAKLEQAKANNQTLKVSYTTVLFCGSSGVGKTTMLNKLNKDCLNKRHHSTGLAESKHTISVKTTAVVKSTRGLQWANLDYDLMISNLNKHLRNLTPASPLPEENSLRDLDNRLHVSQGQFLDSGVSKNAAANTKKVGVHMQNLL